MYAVRSAKISRERTRTAVRPRSTATTSLAVLQIGESGRSARELEKTIALLKKVVERSQAETKQLKQSHGYVSAEQLTVLQGDNQQLKVSHP